MAVKIDAKKFGKVVVLLGGLSGEREVSLVTGGRVLQALLQQGIDAHPLDVGHDVIEKLLQMRPDRAFIALHGPGGEDGLMQGVLDIMRIPYTGSDVKASALAMDKYLSKRIWQTCGLPVLPSAIITEEKFDASSIIARLGLPLCVKPVDNGSTLGISKVTDVAKLNEACKEARKFSHTVMFEPWINGREFTVGIIGSEALPPVEIKVASNFYDYSAKYLSNDTSYFCPCDLSLEQKKELQDISLRAYQILGCRHFARADFILDQKNNFWLLEINTIPGLTDHSLVPKAAAAIGIDFPNLILKILEFTL